MKDIELPLLPDADVYTSTALIGYRYSYSKILMQAYARAAVEADRAQRVPDGKVLVDRGALNMVINALRRDAADGRAVRGEMADALLASTPAPAPQEPAEPTDAHRAAYFMRRFLHEEKMLGPNEQAALHFTIAALEAMESAAQHQEPPQQERKPMTDELLAREASAAEVSAVGLEDSHFADGYVSGFRRAERHHGIKE